MKPVAILLTLAGLTAATSAWAAAPHTYRCERLGKGASASDISDRGTIAGTFNVEWDGWHPAIWPRTKVTVLPYVTGLEGANTMVWAINRDGDMAGSASTGSELWPILWTAGVGAKLPQLPHAADNVGEAFMLNLHGHAVGFSTNSAGVEHATLWKDGQVIDLGALSGPDGSRTIASRAHGINASGMVVGRSDTPDHGYHAVQWTLGTPESLVDLGATAFGIASEARAVNRAGVVIGVTSEGSDGVMSRPIGWIKGVAFDLKRWWTSPTGVHDINDSGTVVGYIDEFSRGALVWPHYRDEPIDLNTLLDGDGCRDVHGLPVRLGGASAINNRGQILAVGEREFAKPVAFRLTPLQ